MSSERFENLEFDFQDAITNIRRLSSQIQNYQGDQRQAAVQEAQREIEKADDYLFDMEDEVRNAPPVPRGKMNSKVTSYKNELLNLKRSIKQGNERSDLLGDRPGASTRDRALGNRQTLNQTSDRIANTQRLAAESEMIGEQVMVDLHDQRETIVRSGQRLRGVDSNLSRANKVLNGMTRRIMTNKIIMMATIFLLICILGAVIYLKFFK
eukprot:TRINITY_DN10235_c0_g3_i1.p1 TRINITY_DN10235_c0_g3~~TRINITY_DN10235_c0_g3_i1.p1  ORF type:complete len:210 (+),score=60.00 TRINITY_DN10235_c0_g3_i1:121-750(+)